MPEITVMCNGCFDCFHYGHFVHLKAARALGDRLVIALTDDPFVNKGPGRPLFPWKERMEILAALPFVDAVYQVSSAEHGIRLVRPDIYVKGIEYEDELPERAMVERYGGRVVFLDERPRYSSTKIMTGEMLRERTGTP